MSAGLAWHRFGWGGIVFLALIVDLTVMLLLRTPDQQVRDTVEVTVHVHGKPDDHAELVRRGDRWVGRVSDFPPGSVADVQPRGSPGFFVVRDAGGSFRALSDRRPQEALAPRGDLPG